MAAGTLTLAPGKRFRYTVEVSVPCREARSAEEAAIRVVAALQAGQWKQLTVVVHDREDRMAKPRVIVVRRPGKDPEVEMV